MPKNAVSDESPLIEKESTEEKAKRQFLDATRHTTVLPHFAAAREAFLLDLPELLEKYSGEWVAYHESEQIAIDANRTKLEQICHDKGFDLQRCLIKGIKKQTASYFT